MQSEAPFPSIFAAHPMFQMFPQLRQVMEGRPGFAELLFQLGALQRGEPTADIVNQFFDAYNPPGPPPTEKAFLANLEKEQRPFDPETPEATRECAVCTEEYAAGDFVLPLPCRHTFHKDCVMTWLKDHNTCPTCRHEFPADPTAEAPEPAAAAPEPFLGHDPFGMRPMALDEDEFSEYEMQEAIRISLQGAEAEARKVPTPEEIQAMPVRELKERLQRRGVDYSGALEKAELGALLERSYQ
jgi:hypothetical protein